MPDTIQKSDFPRFGTLEEQLRFLLRYAVLAPSSHNTQPWKCEIDGNEIVLRADRSRAMPALDPQGRELIISCGAVLHHLCLAIRAFDYAALVQVFPDPHDPDVLARVRLAAPRPATPEEELLFSFITGRHTNRGPFQSRALPDELLLALQEEAKHEGATLLFTQSEEQKSEIVELIERGDIAQNHDPAVRRDIADWIAPLGGRSDGVPAQALGTGALSHLTHRIFDRGQSVADNDAKLADQAPILAVLCTQEDGKQAWLSAGQALSRILLRARSENVWASFFSQPVQFDEARLLLRHILDTSDYPQLVFRLGTAEPVPATPRRLVADVTTTIASDEAG